LIEAAANGEPKDRLQRTAPVTGSSPYAFAFSVVTTTVPLTTSGWA